ncbi:MAG: type IV pilus biogenesis/stability protein PilW [Pseudomonadota bacterium]
MKKILWLMVVLAGCATTPGTQTTAQVPVSEQPTVGDAAARAKVHTDLGMLYFQAGNMAVALQEGRIALASDANYAPAYNLLGLVHMYLGEAAAARQNLERAQRLAPGDPEINNNYGWFLCTQGQEKRGIELLLNAVKNPLYQTPTRPYTNAGLCALRLKDDKAAEDYFRKAAGADPNNAQAFYQLADINFRRGDYYRAKQFVSEVHRVTEPNAESLWLALRIERKLGDRQAEASYAAQLRRKFAGSPEHQALMQGRYE